MYAKRPRVALQCNKGLLCAENISIRRGTGNSQPTVSNEATAVNGISNLINWTHQLSAKALCDHRSALASPLFDEGIF